MWRLSNNFFNYFAADVSQAEIPACVTVGKRLVIEAEQMQHCRVQIMHVNGVFDRFEAKFIGPAVDCSPFDPAAREPNGKSIWIMVAALGFLAGFA